MNKVIQFFQDEPVVFWSGLVNVLVDIGIQAGLPITQDQKLELIGAATMLFAYIARQKVSPTKGA
jgi:hypothetical protein